MAIDAISARISTHVPAKTAASTTIEFAFICFRFRQIHARARTAPPELPPPRTGAECNAAPRK
jgi:hypothetical protein